MKYAKLVLESSRPEETESLGCQLASLVPLGSVVGLNGELATGKTCFVRGMASYFSRADAVHSPTFTLVNQYGTDPPIYHVDLYRVNSEQEFIDLGYPEFFDPDGLCVVEWADRVERLLPLLRVDVLLEHTGPTSRRLTFLDYGILPSDWPRQLSKAHT